MDALQNLTKTENQNSSSQSPDVNPDELLTESKERFISFKAVGGISVEVGQSISKVSMQEFADSINVSRQTLYDWQNGGIPNFWERVKVRREAIMSRDMVANVWQRVYLDAMAGKEPQQRLILGKFDDWKPPAQAHDVKMTGWADIINSARKRNQIPEGETIDG